MSPASAPDDGAAAGPPAVGNDVVDLADSRCLGRARDARFLGRILTRREAAAVREAADPEAALWLRWAAKEAAFKAATAVRGAPPVFEHAAFEVEQTGAHRGVVRWRELTLPWCASGGDGGAGIHVVAWRDEPHGGLVVEGGCERMVEDFRIPRERFTARELEALHSSASAQVRLRARRHAAELTGVDEGELEIVSHEGPPGRAPPRLLRGGRPWRWRVGLSHHGRLLAWVLARRTGAGERAGPVTAPRPPAPR